VALASGFGSVRRFNAVVRDTFGRTPGALRRTTEASTPGVTLRLPFRPPYDWPGVLGFLAPRAIPGVESVVGGVYRRTIDLDGARGVVEVRPGGSHALLATIALDRLPPLAGAVARLRHLFDLDADPEAIGAHLGRDPVLAARLARHPGVRVPGAWDAFELAVRAILGQQVSVAGATTLAGRLAAAYGEPLARADAGVLFPRPERLAGADLSPVGLPRARAAAISSLASAVVGNPALLRADGGTGVSVARLAALPGIGPWTAEYVAMRALREPDAFPSSDLGLLRAMGPHVRAFSPARLLRRAERWRPWRAYAAMLLWLGDGPGADGTGRAGDEPHTRRRSRGAHGPAPSTAREMATTV
jgi:AraC family transcriptional regulator of adaptative response / DNA-3-methyladenine glycosylase II